jgi:hypothetical protein
VEIELRPVLLRHVEAKEPQPRVEIPYVGPGGKPVLAVTYSRFD